MPSWKKIIVSGSNAKLHHISASGNIVPITTNASSLGSLGLNFSDLFLDTGAVINFDGGDVTATHSSNLLTIAGGNIRVDRLEIDAATNYVDVDTDLKVIAAADIVLDPGGNNVVPGSDSADDLGASGTAWNKLWVDDIELNAQGSLAGAVNVNTANVYATGIISGSNNLFIGKKGTYSISASNGNIELTGNISGSATSTGSFGRIEVSADTLAIGGTEINKTVADNITALNQTLNTTSSPVFAGLRVTGDVHAERYIVSSSVSIITQSFSSGSTIFGDSITDTHKFTGSMYISGGIFPGIDDKFDLGASGAEWKDLYIDGTANIDSIAAFSLTGKLTAGSTEIEGSNFDINGGTVDAITSLTVANDVDVGNYKITSKALEASDLTSGRVTFAGSNGLLADDSDLTFSTATLSATNLTTTGTIKDFSVASGSLTSTGSFGRAEVQRISVAKGFVSLTATGNISGGLASTGSFGRLETNQANALLGSNVLTLGGALTTAAALTQTGTAITLTGAGQTNTLTLNEGFTIGDGHTGTLTFSAASKVLTVENTSTINQDVTSDADVTFGSVTTTGAVTVGGNLVVNGTTTTLATSNLAIEDAFGFFATGSAGTNVDGGIIVQSGSFVDSGSAIYHDKSSQRWSVARGVGADETVITETQWSGFVATVTTASATPTGATKANYGVGEIYIDSSGDVFIYS